MVVVSYSGLYEEGEVEHINCSHTPLSRRGQNGPHNTARKVTERSEVSGSKGELIKAEVSNEGRAYIAMWLVGGRAALAIMKNFVKLQTSCLNRENWPNTVDVLDFTFFIQSRLAGNHHVV